MHRLRTVGATCGALLAALLLALPAPAAAQATVVYVVRHAERAGEGADPPLSEAGRDRTEALVRLLADAPLVSVLSTDLIRTRDTATPVAVRHGLEVELYDPADRAALAARLRTAAGHHLVVGHSNTVPQMVRLLGGDPGGPIADGEYDRLYLVMPVQGEEGSRTVLLRFGEPFPR